MTWQTKLKVFVGIIAYGGWAIMVICGKAEVGPFLLLHTSTLAYLIGRLEREN